MQAGIRLAGDPPRHLTPLLPNNLFQASRDDRGDFLAADREWKTIDENCRIWKRISEQSLVYSFLY